jgi:uncharacterized protein (DUF2235 family)
MSKIIVLLADGTGNSAAQLFKTNVWRLYKALDLRDPPPDGSIRQIAYYHDGVGTSSFKPLTMLGGVFGVGLKRNVIDIYTFLCRNYDEGDRIFAYGFSRGAFTIRVLAGVVLTQGVLRCRVKGERKDATKAEGAHLTEQELKRYAADAYRAYRRGYKLPIFERKNKTEATNPAKTVGLVDRLRNLRRGVLIAWRRFRRHPQYSEISRSDAKIDFIGVWDTVAAYGLPIDEMTRGIDEWIWPLSMPNYALHPSVLRARHALSLDDERDTFHPLLWDEVAEDILVEKQKALPVEKREVLPGRLQQVWFAGVHSNVGGGYADDSLSYVPLEWMMDESEKRVPRLEGGKVTEQPGLRFLPPDEREVRLPPRDDFGRRYNSRSGVAAYYRYQPRRIAARLESPDPHTLMMQDPNRKGKGLLKRVQVHESVFHRIRAGNDRYAPIVLPEQYEVVKFDGTVAGNSGYPPPERKRVEWVWNDVWRRRVNYFMTIGVTAVLALFPLIQFIWPPSACVGPQCLLTPVIGAIGAVLPGFVQPWIEAFAVSPGWFLLVALIIFGLLLRSRYLERSVQDGMRELWEQSLKLPLGSQPSAAIAAPEHAVTPAGRSTGIPRARSDGWIYWLRTARGYQGFFRMLKWQGIPGLFGATVLFGGAILILLLIVVGVQRGRLAYAEWTNQHCATGVEGLRAEPGLFDTRSLCWRAQAHVQEGARYRVTMRAIEDWVDETMPAWPMGFVIGSHTIPTSPRGYASDELKWYMRPSVLMRRSLSGRWFQPMLKIVPADERGGHVQLLEMTCACGQAADAVPPGQRRPAVYTADFEAAITGEVFLYVNELAALMDGPTSLYYDNNWGKAEVRIDPID